MHFGKHNKNFEYCIKDSKLHSTTHEKDIGVLISNTMKWNQHVNMVVNKANSRLGLLSKSFTYKDKNTMKILYCTFVGSILEYASPIENPYNKNDIHKLEIVQQRATNFDKVFWYQQPKTAISISANDPAANIRGHKARVDFEQIKRNRPRKNFLTNSVAKWLNKLPEEIISAKSVKILKRKLDKHMDILKL
ncbi:uncharacterized protein LOC136080279 [Hydra vulgaris]|uniref:Uncharacterized protein LOC136080279 n=1 Tax=Hydra vulgaris TaxID=6087 RepID=A0ABM4BUV4_HYDVU